MGVILAQLIRNLLDPLNMDLGSNVSCSISTLLGANDEISQEMGVARCPVVIDERLYS